MTESVCGRTSLSGPLPTTPDILSPTTGLASLNWIINTAAGVGVGGDASKQLFNPLLSLFGGNTTPTLAGAAAPTTPTANTNTTTTTTHNNNNNNNNNNNSLVSNNNNNNR